MATIESPFIALANDTALVAKARVGDAAAFDELYRRHSEAAWRLAQAVTRNADDAAEATSEAFAKVFSALERGAYDASAPFRPYLLAATRNAAIDTIRASSRVETTDDADVLDLTTIDQPGERLVADEDAALVRDAFKSLPERHRTVLWLIEVEGMKPREAAAILGLSPNATSQLAVRARASLREHYVQGHLSQASSRECRRVVTRLGAYVAGDLAPGDVAKVDQHLAGCEECSRRLAELNEVRSRLRTIAMPIPLLLASKSAARWAKSVAVTGGRAQRILAGAGALFVGAGVLGATLFGAGGGGRSRTELTRPVTAAPVVPADQLDDPSLDLTSAFQTAVSGGGSGGTLRASHDVARGVDGAVSIDDGARVTNPIPATKPPGGGGPDVPLPPGPGVDPDAPGGIGVQVNLGGAYGGDSLVVSVGDCTGVDLSGNGAGCTGEAPDGDGLAVDVGTPVPGVEHIEVHLP